LATIEGSGMHHNPADLPTESADTPAPVFLRMRLVMRMTGLGRSTIYRLMAEDRFPSPVRLTNRAVAWRRSDLDRWSEGRPTVPQ
jgi:prophage regulatory protein